MINPETGCVIDPRIPEKVSDTGNDPDHERLILSLRARRDARINDGDGRDSLRPTSHARRAKRNSLPECSCAWNAPHIDRGRLAVTDQRGRADLSEA
jgi:hypothetical protein